MISTLLFLPLLRGTVSRPAIPAVPPIAPVAAPSRIAAPDGLSIAMTTKASKYLASFGAVLSKWEYWWMMKGALQTSPTDAKSIAHECLRQLKATMDKVQTFNDSQTAHWDGVTQIARFKLAQNELQSVAERWYAVQMKIVTAGNGATDTLWEQEIAIRTKLEAAFRELHRQLAASEWFDAKQFERVDLPSVTYRWLGTSSLDGVQPNPFWNESCIVGWSADEDRINSGARILSVKLPDGREEPTLNWTYLGDIVDKYKLTELEVTYAPNAITGDFTMIATCTLSVIR